jgi:predicted RNase H-like nuclease
MTEPGVMSELRVLGIDACKRGWVGIALSERALTPYYAADIGDLVAKAENDGSVEVVAIDIPIGLPDTGRRQADVLARQAAGPRWASVFITPVRAALEAGDYLAAAEANRRLANEGVSRQAFALKPKLMQVDQWVRRTPHRVVEIHPEVSFAMLAGGPLQVRKSSWSGAHRRTELLADAGIVLPGELGEAGLMAGVDDVLDAAVAAWSARRVARGRARVLPDPPERFSDGLACAIWS